MSIKELRSDCGWSLEELAKLYGVDIETLIKYESRLEYPTIETINKLLTESSLYYDNISCYQSEDMCIY